MEIRHLLIAAQMQLVEAEEAVIEAAHPRSPDWPTVAAAHLEREPRCIFCGTRDHLIVHHQVPYWHDPLLELVETNLATVCQSPSHNDHFILAHLLSWHRWHPNVRAFAATYRRALELAKEVERHD